MRRNVHLFNRYPALQFLILSVIFSITVNAQIFGDLEKPILKILASPEQGDLLVQLQKSLLDDVQRIFPVAEK